MSMGEKHVIFLGAGASYSSGYPLAEDLRLIISSPEAFGQYLYQKVPDVYAPARVELNKWVSGIARTLKLFREGGFGTVDEFSALARSKYHNEIHEMKQVVGVAIALHNPESLNGFQSSDYYPFIQKLFREKEDPRNDVAILTYNYDPYFDFLLSRAYKTRKIATGKQPLEPTELTSGFGDRNANAICEGDGFCFLKLHGTAVLPPQAVDSETCDDFLTYNQIFRTREKWLSLSRKHLFGLNPCPCMYFPWDLINPKNEFVGQEQFAEFEAHAPDNLTSKGPDKSMYNLCKAIWRRAQREIAHATKISFVGLSMHEFLRPGLRFLFAERTRRMQGKADPLEIVLACPGALSHGTKFGTAAHPNSLSSKLGAMLCDVYPSLSLGTCADRGKFGTGYIACHDDFRSFIKTELN